MDTKRLIFAIALSVIVIMVYNHFFVPKPKRPPLPQQTPGQQQAVPAESEKGTGAGTGADTDTGEKAADASRPDSQLPDIFSKKKKVAVKEETLPETVEENLADKTVKEVTVETDLFRAVFTNKGAGLKSFILKKYKDDIKEPMDLISSKVNEKFGTHEIYPFYLSPFEDVEEFREINNHRFLYKGDLTVSLDGSGDRPKEILFEYADTERKIYVMKRFTFSNGSYVLKVDYKVVIGGEVLEKAPIIFGPDLENNISKNRLMQAALRIGAYNGEDVKEVVFPNVKSQRIDGPVEQAEGILGSNFYWAAYDTNYFAAIFKTHEEIKFHVVKKKIDKDQQELYSYIIAANPKLVYLGPKDEQILAKIEEQHQFKDAGEVVDYGWGFIGSIAKIMLKGILLIYGFIPNYGWALVFFTIFVKILLFPLTYASSVSMAKMQTLQPKIKAIKKKYKNQKDPEQRRQMNQETMALYKQEKVNPAGGCLPMLLQMPILFAFFRLLPISITFRHEPWILWITDLSVKDPIYALPILMGATQIIVSKMSPTTGDSAQKKIMYIMPVVMVILFMSYSSGLNLYWFIANLLQIGQQYIINQKIYKEKKDEDRQRRAQKRKKGGKAK